MELSRHITARCPGRLIRVRSHNTREICDFKPKKFSQAIPARFDVEIFRKIGIYHFLDMHSLYPIS